MFRADEDNDSKWCICGHHIASHVEDGSVCKDKFCYGQCKEFIPCTILSVKECLKRYRLLLPVLRERFVIRNSKTLSLFNLSTNLGDNFRAIIDKCLQLEKTDEYELRNHVVRNIMKKNNLHNLDELDRYLKRFHKLARPLIYSDKELARSEYNRRSRIVARETKAEMKRLLKEEYIPKRSKGNGWSTFKDHKNNRLMAISTSRKKFGGKQKTKVIGPLPEDLAWKEYRFRLWLKR
jgi:hypothetical protein